MLTKFFNLLNKHLWLICYTDNLFFIIKICCILSDFQFSSTQDKKGLKVSKKQQIKKKKSESKDLLSAIISMTFVCFTTPDLPLLHACYLSKTDRGRSWMNEKCPTPTRWIGGHELRCQEMLYMNSLTKETSKYFALWRGRIVQKDATAVS